MKRLVTVSVISALAWMGLATVSRAQTSTPQVIRLQGFLSRVTGSTRTPVSGPVTMTFRLYNNDIGGTLQTTFGPTTVTVTNGIYEVELPFTRNRFAGANRYLEIEADGETMTPRLRMTSAPYAYVADTLDGFEGPELDDTAEIAAHTADPDAHREHASLEESLEIDADIAAHAAAADPHPSYLRKAGGTMTGAITFTSGAGAMLNMYSTGFNNVERPVIAHSPAFPTWGLKYRDSDDTYVFQGDGLPALAVNLTNRTVGIGTGTPGAGMALDIVGTTRTQVLTITGGSDVAEPFEVSGAAPMEPGTVVSIDPDGSGGLRMSDRPYDRTVAGVISGANGIKPGLTLEQEGTVASGTVPVAMTGRVFCRADASSGPIRPGDLLTTSAVPGHAMRVEDPSLAQGAILGKALGSLDAGRGLVLVLINLQ